ncbi:MAG: Fe-S oxidoreductase [uncultured Nocardioides sp.]|uniref:Fe-S oxidoreductase n=1 Tax=uncultured Nocardioides sp. TaxID=198441 RepID=A0A6J4PA73_9ACTN|nr:MAG: Fe-S oxidoreductase [uncultured Nocardioides sp.]
MVQTLALVLSLTVTVVAVVLFTRTVGRLVSVLRLGQPAPGRTDQPGARTATMVKETLAHTRMLQWTRVGVAHWFLMIGFGLLFATLVNAYGQLFDAHFVLPVIGHFPPFEWLTELFAWAMVLAIVPLFVYRVTRPRQRVRGPEGRFYGSTMWQGYFVEAVILGVGLCILTLRGLEHALARFGEDPGTASLLHFPLTAWIGGLFGGLGEGTLATLVWLVAATKIAISMTWLIVLALNPTMGVAWHRFTVWPNIWLKRKSGGGPSLGAAAPMLVAGKPVDFETLDELDEDAALGVGKVEDFTWKGLLDFTTCTECGRCQSQCPAWNTDKPLSPKLLITNLRDHAYAKAPLLLADEDQRASLPAELHAEAERPLVGATQGDPAMPSGGAVIDPEVLWSCTTCGACVQQCPVDIEHVDHVLDMRRYQVLIESAFPAELNGLFKGLETKGNPWNMSPRARLDWAKGLDFEVKVVGQDVEDLSEVEWLFWVGCAGAYEDRAKKTTQAVAELLHLAGVSFAVLGDGETCSGDPARRAGNEFVFQQLAMENSEVLKESGAKKVVSTCAHCFNTLKNEYSAFGVELEVVHHTQLLNRLVREGKLTPVPQNGTAKRTITYHDPCYLGRHNQVYVPPRELLGVIPSAQLQEMPRNSERSFCCGGGGARMWMEERTGERINVNRITEAVATGADQVATGCPFCRVMLSDGLIAKQAEGSARNEVEVLDVAQLLLASVKAAPAAPVAAGGSGTPAAQGTAQLERPVEVGAGAGATETGETGTASASPSSDTEPPDGAATDLDARDATAGDTSASTAPADDAAVRTSTDEGPAGERS